MQNSISRLVRMLTKGNFSPQAIDKLHRWLASSAEWEEKDAVLREIWDGTPEKKTICTHICCWMLCRKLRIAGKQAGLMRPVMLTAACTLALIVAGTFWFAANREIEMITVTATADAAVEYTLPDSTKVWLNTKSSLSYPKKFKKKARQVSLTGEGFFKVKPDQSSPFIISANCIKVIVTGTELCVKAHAQDDQISVSLLNGKASVELSTKEGRSSKTDECYVLTPNQHLTFDIKNQLMNIEQRTLLVPAWISGELIFEDLTFTQIMQGIELHFEVKALFDSTVMPQGCYSIKFSNGETLEEVMYLLQDFLQEIKYDIKDETVTIIPF